MSFRHSIFMGLLALFIHPVAQACSVCGCGDPLASAGTAHPLANSFRLTLESAYLTASALSDDDDTQTESVRQVNLNTTLSYSPTDNLSLTVLLPLVEKYWALSAGDASPDEGTPFGFGDMMLGVRYFFISDTDFKTKQHLGVAVSGGTYLPTGGTNFTSLITGDSLDTHSQLGTGAVGFYTGLLLNRAWEGFTLSVNANLLVRTTPTTSDPDSPVYRYTFGNAFTGGIQGQLDLSEYWAASLAVEGRYADADTADDGGNIVPVGNTGGTVIDLTPGISWNVTGDAALYAKVQVPFLTNLNGVQQVDPTYILGTQFLIR
ncbi:MAG TPA: hypothetical protein VHE12_12385 [bacterium]|nr:hypothetical protein [bacterium]